MMGPDKIRPWLRRREGKKKGKGSYRGSYSKKTRRKPPPPKKKREVLLGLSVAKKDQGVLKEMGMNFDSEALGGLHCPPTTFEGVLYCDL